MDNNGSLIFNDPQATDTILIGTNDNELIIRTDDGDITLKTNENKQALRVSNNGDINFYEDTGTTAKLVWDASAESLGIGVAPQTQLTLQSTTPFIRLQDDQSTVSAGTNMGGIEFRTADSTVVGASRITGKIRVEGDGTFNASDKSPSRMIFSTHATSGTDPVDALTINSSQNVGIGTTSPDSTLTMSDTVPIITF